MADTGWKSPGTCANVDRDGKTSWIDVNEVKVSDNDDAMQSLPPGYGDWLRCTNFSMGVPAGATIDGIIVSIEKDASNSNSIKDSSIRLRETVGQVGDDKATGDWWSTTEAYVEHGGAVDDWNAGLDANDVNHADFGVDISANNEVGSARIPMIDHVRIKVYYTEVVAGWGEDLNGIANANIAKINGINIADIAKVNGV